MGVDEVSDPIKSPLGYHVIKVTEKQEELTQPLTEVRETIINTLKQERAAARAAALAQAIAAEVSVPEDLDRAAASRGLEVQESAFAGPESRFSVWDSRVRYRLVRFSSRRVRLTGRSEHRSGRLS